MPHQQKMLGLLPGIGPHMLESQNRPVGAWPGLQSHWPNSFSSCSSLTPPSSLHITPIVIIITANIIIITITNIKLFTTIIHINTLSTVITISSISISMNIHQNKEVSSLIIIKRITITNPHHQQHHQHYQMLSVRLMNVIMNLGWERLRVLDGVGEVDIDDYEWWWWRWWWLGWRLKVVTMATFGKFGRDLFSCCTGLSTYGLFWFKQNK